MVLNGFLKKNIICSAPIEGRLHPTAEKDGTRGAFGSIRHMKRCGGGGSAPQGSQIYFTNAKQYSGGARA